MSTHLVSVVFDVVDPGRAAHWWSDALGWPVSLEDPGEVVVEPLGTDLEDQVPALVFLPVDEPKGVKNRVHLDLGAESVDHQRAIVERLRASGAEPADVGQPADVTWEVLTDPFGNELCVLAGHHDGGPLAAICLDVVDVEAMVPFWTGASGWTVLERDVEGVSLQNPTGRRPTLDLFVVPDPPTVKNRVHLDVAPSEGADQAAEVERLLALGATHADVGQGDDVTWVVLADPEGNEFCVLSPRAVPGG